MTDKYKPLSAVRLVSNRLIRVNAVCEVEFVPNTGKGVIVRNEHCGWQYYSGYHSLKDMEPLELKP